MMKLIDADALWMDVIHAMDYCDDFLEFIDRMPEAVVRCKDCENLRKVSVISDDGMEFELMCTIFGTFCDENDYCSHGERRDDE